MSRLSEIAIAAGVSVGTVSHVLNGKGDERRIAKATQSRIMQKAEELGYVNKTSEPASQGQINGVTAGRAKHTPVLSLLFRNNLTITVLGELLYGIQRVQAGSNYPFVSNILFFGAENPENLIQTVKHLQTDGIVFFGLTDDETRLLEQTDIMTPMVLINRPSQKYNNVIIDNSVVKRVVLKNFSDKGHRNVAMFVTKGFLTEHKVSYEDGKRAFQNLCDEYSLNASIYLRSNESPSDFGYRMTIQAMKLVPRPTVLFFSTDISALSGMKALHDLGIRVPEDIEILTCGTDQVLDYMIPSVSSARYAIDEAVEYCINILINRYYKNDTGRKCIIFDPSFTYRETFSCAVP